MSLPRRILLPAELIVILGGVSAALHVGKLPPAIPVLREALGITLVQAGFLLSLVQFAGMTLGLALGLTADGIGLRRSMITGLAILCMSSALGGWAHDASTLLWLRGIEGLGFLLVVLPAPSLIRQLVPFERLNLTLGIWGGYMPFGTAAALLSGPWVLQAIGWPGWWWGLAAFSGLMALWMTLGVPSDARRRLNVSVATPSAPAAAGNERWWHRLAQTLSARGPWLVALIFTLYSGQWLAVIGFLPSIYDQAGISSTVAGALTAFAAACNVLGNLSAGRLRHRGVKPRHLIFTGYIAMIAGAFLAFSSIGFPPLVRYAGVVIFSGVGGMIPATLFMLAVHLAPSERTVSTTMGWMQQCSACGQFAGAPIVAWVASLAGGWQWTWAVTGAASLLGMFLVTLLPRKPRR